METVLSKLSLFVWGGKREQGVARGRRGVARGGKGEARGRREGGKREARGRQEGGKGEVRGRQEGEGDCKGEDGGCNWGRRGVATSTSKPLSAETLSASSAWVPQTRRSDVLNKNKKCCVCGWVDQPTGTYFVDFFDHQKMLLPKLFLFWEGCAECWTCVPLLAVRNLTSTTPCNHHWGRKFYEVWNKFCCGKSSCS